MKTLGLDLAAANSGLCIIETRLPYTYDVILEKAFRHPMKDFTSRVEVANTILEIAREHKPDVIVIEDYIRYMGRINTSAYEHAEVGGMVKKLLYEDGFNFFLLPPTTMRSFIGAKPKSPKNFLEEAAHKRFGYKSTASTQKQRSDITDAFIHAQIGALVTYLREGKDIEYKLLRRELSMLYGKKNVEGLVTREGIYYGKNIKKRS